MKGRLALLGVTATVTEVSPVTEVSEAKKSLLKPVQGIPGKALLE